MTDSSVGFNRRFYTRAMERREELMRGGGLRGVGARDGALVGRADWADVAAQHESQATGQASEAFSLPTPFLLQRLSGRFATQSQFFLGFFRYQDGESSHGADVGAAVGADVGVAVATNASSPSPHELPA
jgi:hypothetical protein